MNVHEIVLGALLHDIGKFLQRANGYKQGLSPQSLKMEAMLCPKPDSYVHVLYTNEFVEHCLPDRVAELDRSAVANLASYHHRPSTPEQAIVTEADRLSSGMEREPDESAEGLPSFRKVRLRSVAGSVSLSEDDRPGSGERAAIGVARLSAEAGFPGPNDPGTDLTADYYALWQAFTTNWSANECRQPLDYINRALSVLEQYTWCIPSATNVLPDISLFDHLKTTSAIAVCLHQASAEAKPFLLVVGDLTGIQKYIYAIHQGAGRHARLLRARSFQVAAYSEAISLGIINQLGLPLACRILMAGGKFELLLPNTERVKAALQDVNTTAAGWLYEQSTGELGLSLAWVAAGREELERFSALSDQAHRALRGQRNRAAANVLVRDGRWDESRFLLPAPEFGAGREEICATCRKRPAPLRPVRDGEARVCDLCDREAKIGKDLPSARYVVLYADRFGPNQTPAGSYGLVKDAEKIPGHPALVLDLDNGEGRGRLPIVRAMRARTIPRDDDGELLTFEEIASSSSGRPALGWLKMDVDNLGLIFLRGLKREDSDQTSISRVATLSRTLDLFFSGYIETLLGTDEFRHVYMVYSGGDDLLAVGPWNVMFDFALTVRSSFRRFTADNPCWTLSAGLASANAHTPVLTAVQWAEEALEASKRLVGAGVLVWPLEGDSTGDPDKDRMTAFGTSIPWAEFPQILNQAKQVRDWLLDKTLRTGQVRRLLRYADLYREFQRTRRTTHLEYAPLFARDLKRNWKYDTTEQQAALKWAQELAAQPPDDASGMKALRFVCEYALNATRHVDREDDEHGER